MLCDSLDCSTPGFHVLHYLPELAHTHVHWVSNAIETSYLLFPPSPLVSVSVSIKYMLCINAICSFFIDFISPMEYINTFHRSLSAILLIFILNPYVVSSCLKNAHLCLCILPWEEILQHLLSNRASLTYLGKMIFPIDFFDVYYSCVFFSYMFLCLHFFLSNCMELCDITELQESFY